ncbi:MAG: hypothetical protein FWD12_16100, partial [Alphaproteobacteria bacterium]|nr:hypothetical protein [Alphaproteobacteria bacterium]
KAAGKAAGKACMVAPLENMTRPDLSNALATGGPDGDAALLVANNADANQATLSRMRFKGGNTVVPA